MPSKLLSWTVTIVAIGVVGTLLAVSIQKARTAAWRMSSGNNLKQLGLAIHNFESTFKKLPSGCDIDAKHGWMSRIHNYIEASSWYSETDFNVSWEHPLNRNHFKIRIPCYHMPIQQFSYTIEGYGVTGYLANPAVMYRNSKVTLAELTSGISSVLVLGESAGNKTPFGYPFNWRKIDWPLDADPDGYRAWSNGVQFCKLDASVLFLSHETDREVIEQFSQAAPLPAPELYQRPDREFEGAHRSTLNFVEFGRQEDRQPRKDDPPTNRVYFDQHGTVDLIDFRSTMADVDGVLSKYLDTKVLRIAFPRTDEELQRILRFSQLEILCLKRRYSYDSKEADGLELNLVLEGLEKLPKLRFLQLVGEPDLLPTIQQALPNCEVVLSRSW